ncbi:hypothetical protein BD414DRAFT_480538 [Trametes punicea]|nr:hypothetical protein BD414DRAFT_480538 [Trametes punicea]
MLSVLFGRFCLTVRSLLSWRAALISFKLAMYYDPNHRNDRTQDGCIVGCGLARIGPLADPQLLKAHATSPPQELGHTRLDRDVRRVEGLTAGQNRGDLELERLSGRRIESVCTRFTSVRWSIEETCQCIAHAEVATHRREGQRSTRLST